MCVSRNDSLIWHVIPNSMNTHINCQQRKQLSLVVWGDLIRDSGRRIQPPEIVTFIRSGIFCFTRRILHITRYSVTLQKYFIYFIYLFFYKISPFEDKQNLSQLSCHLKLG